MRRRCASAASDTRDRRSTDTALTGSARSTARRRTSPRAHCRWPRGSRPHSSQRARSHAPCPAPVRRRVPAGSSRSAHSSFASTPPAAIMVRAPVRGTSCEESVNVTSVSPFDCASCAHSASNASLSVRARSSATRDAHGRAPAATPTLESMKRRISYGHQRGRRGRHDCRRGRRGTTSGCSRQRGSHWCRRHLPSLGRSTFPTTS